MDCTTDADECSLRRKRQPVFVTIIHLPKARFRGPLHERGAAIRPGCRECGTVAPDRPARLEGEDLPGAPVRLLDRVRHVVRTLHYSYRTEQAYVDWVRRFILFHGKRHPLQPRAPEVGGPKAVDRGRLELAEAV